MRIAYFLVILLWCTPVLAQKTLSPLSPPPSQPPQQQQQQIAPDYRGTQDVPLIVKELPRELSTEEKETEEAKQRLDRELVERIGDLASYTEDLFIATIVLAGLAGALFIVAVYQVRESRKSTKAAEDAATAASASAKATADLAKAATERAGRAKNAVAATAKTAEAEKSG
jgi:hypothetical protein